MIIKLKGDKLFSSVLTFHYKGVRLTCDQCGFPTTDPTYLMTNKGNKTYCPPCLDYKMTTAIILACTQEEFEDMEKTRKLKM